MLARYLSAPTKLHLTGARRVLSYLLHTKKLGLTYTKTTNPVLVAFVDSSWAACKDTRRSRYGYAVYMGNALVSWRSKLHNCMALSTAEAEYVGATEVCKEVMYLRFQTGVCLVSNNCSVLAY